MKEKSTNWKIPLIIVVGVIAVILMGMVRIGRNVRFMKGEYKIWENGMHLKLQKWTKKFLIHILNMDMDS